MKWHIRRIVCLYLTMNILIFQQVSFWGYRAYVDDVAQWGQQQCMRLEGCRCHAARGGRVAGWQQQCQLKFALEMRRCQIDYVALAHIINFCPYARKAVAGSRIRLRAALTLPPSRIWPHGSIIITAGCNGYPHSSWIENWTAVSFEICCALIASLCLLWFAVQKLSLDFL